MQKCEVIAICNQKGGVGKTTTTFNLGVALSKLGKKVLLIDADPQNNLTTHLGFYDENELSLTIADLIDNSIKNNIIDDKEYIMKHVENVDLIPSSLDLSVVQLSLVNAMCREYALKSGIQELKNNYDYVLIDCPPSLGILTTNALGASDSVLIPVQCEYFALEGIMQLINTIMLAQKKVNPNLEIEGVLLTMLTTNTNLGLEVVESIKGYFKERVYDTIIPRLIRLAEAPSHGKPILEYEPRSRGTLAYLNLAKEVIEKNGTEKESIG